MKTKIYSREQVNPTFGKWVRRQLYEIERPADWLHRRLGIARGSVNRWTNGSDLGHTLFLRTISILSKERQVPYLELLKDYWEYYFND